MTRPGQASCGPQRYGDPCLLVDAQGLLCQAEWGRAKGKGKGASRILSFRSPIVISFFYLRHLYSAFLPERPEGSLPNANAKIRKTNAPSSPFMCIQCQQPLVKRKASNLTMGERETGQGGKGMQLRCKAGQEWNFSFPDSYCRCSPNRLGRFF